MDVAHCDDGDTGHGDDEFAVFFDPLDVAFGTLVDAIDDAHSVAGVVLGRISAEVPHVTTGIGRGHEDEGAHLHVANHARLAGLGIRVVHERIVVVALERHQPRLRAPHEHERRNELHLGIGQVPTLILLDGVVRHVGLDAFRLEQRFEIHHAVVEDLKGVPVESRGGWFDN